MLRELSPYEHVRRLDRTEKTPVTAGGVHVLPLMASAVVISGGEDFTALSPLGDPGDVLILSELVEPGVVFDVRAGAIVIEDGAEVRAGTRLEGPLFVGPGTRVLGGAVRGSVLGPDCRIHGEVAASVFLGQANKSHDGFVGHSVVGRWALAAGSSAPASPST